jgi:hypothetical protein
MTTATCPAQTLLLTLDGVPYELRPAVEDGPDARLLCRVGDAGVLGVVTVIPSRRLRGGALEVFVFGTPLRIAYLIPYGHGWVTAQTPLPAQRPHPPTG